MQQNKGKVLRLFISTGITDSPRREVDALEVDEKGVKEDKFYAQDPNRAILVSCVQSYELAKTNAIDIQEGVLGEIIEIGECRFEVTQNCTLCKGLSQISPKLPKLLKNDRGIFVRALNKGKISIADEVVLHPQAI